MTIDEFDIKLQEVLNTSSGRLAEEGVRECCNELQISQCSNPQTLWLRSSATGHFVPYSIPCGSCYHCKATKMNEWATRMCLETLYNKHCYFLTLTYKSYDRYEDIPRELLDAYWLCDNNNQNGKYCYSPCLIRGEHVSRFMKNLRNDFMNKVDNFECKFFAGSEYGSTYGRPHHHVVLWTNTPLTITDIIKAWSHREQPKTAKGQFKEITFTPYCSLEGFNFNDLCENGTLATDSKARIDGKVMNASSAFKYVAKYMQKGSKGESLCESGNYTRVLAAKNDLLRRVFNDYNLVFTEPICSKLWTAFKRYAGENYFNNLPFPTYEQLKSYQHEKVFTTYMDAFNAFFSDSLALDPHALDSTIAKELGIPVEDLENKTFEGTNIFCKLFDYRTTMSRGSGIGMLYAKQNIQRFAEGNYTFSKDVTEKFGTLVMPTAFLRKTKEYISGLLFPSTSQQFESQILFRDKNRDSNLNTLTRSDIPLSRSLRQNSAEILDLVCGINPELSSVSAYTLSLPKYDQINGKTWHAKVNNQYNIYDPYNHRHYVFATSYGSQPIIDDSLSADEISAFGDSERALEYDAPFCVPFFSLNVLHYQYNRSSRSYVLVGNEPISSFARRVLVMFDKEYNIAIDNEEKHLQTWTQHQSLIKLVHDKLGLTMQEEMTNAYNRACAERADMQRVYNKKHLTNDKQ